MASQIALWVIQIIQNMDVLEPMRPDVGNRDRIQRSSVGAFDVRLGSGEHLRRIVHAEISPRIGSARLVQLGTDVRPIFDRAPKSMANIDPTVDMYRDEWGFSRKHFRNFRIYCCYHVYSGKAGTCSF